MANWVLHIDSALMQGDSGKIGNDLFGSLQLLAVVGFCIPWGAHAIAPQNVVSELVLSKTNHQCLIEKNKSKLKTRMNILATLKAGWNNDKNTKPIDTHVQKNVLAILATCPDCLLEGWNLYPCANGTLMMDLTNGSVNASVNITLDRVSGFWENGAAYCAFDDESFNVAKMQEFLNEVKLLCA